MIKKKLILLVFSSLYSCRNYENSKYLSKEDEAIIDIIHQLINYDEMVEINHLDTNHLKLFMISSLDTAICDIPEPYGFTVSINGVRLSEAEIEEGRKIYEEEYKNYRKEQKLFAPLKKGNLKRRVLDYKFEYSNLQIELITEPFNYKLKQNEFGYLYISRIIFNRCFDKGYLSYSFFCGEACAWNGNIEIVKINSKWVISKHFQFGIACNYKNNQTEPAMSSFALDGVYTRRQFCGNLKVCKPCVFLATFAVKNIRV